MAEDLTGSRLGHYRIDSVLGRGGMSVTYRATDTRLGRKVALKVIGEHLTADAEFRERFVDEARNTSAIDHANIVPLYDFNEIDGLLYIAMRLVDGQDLSLLLKNGPLSPDRALTLLGQVAEALDMLHGKGLVHLDVKPANVLVTTKEGIREHVYLADFGLTRRGATGHRTRTGDFLGSPTYAAPEHLRGEPLDGRTDQYALACMLFACLVGRAPFTGTVPEVIQSHLTSEIPAVSTLTPLPPAIDLVIRRGAAKDANQRFGSCQELIAAARAALMISPPSGPISNAAYNNPQIYSGGFPAVNPMGLGTPPAMTGANAFPFAQAQQQPWGATAQQGASQSGHAAQRQGIQFGPPESFVVQTPVTQDPVRLRPPAPVTASGFPSTQSRPVWFWPVIAGTAAIVLIVILILILKPTDEPRRQQTDAPAINTTSIQIGPATRTPSELPNELPGG